MNSPKIVPIKVKVDKKIKQSFLEMQDISSNFVTKEMRTLLHHSHFTITDILEESYYILPGAKVIKAYDLIIDVLADSWWFTEEFLNTCIKQKNRKFKLEF